jgi:hypothetical protein
MSFLTGTNTELIYSMPAVGATIASTTATPVTGNSASNPAYFMPPLLSIWPGQTLVGKCLRFVARGTSDNTAVNNTMALRFDPTQATAGTLVAGTGAAAWTSNTVNSWEFEVELSCISQGNNTSGWMTGGILTVGVGNNSSTATGSTFMVGGAQTLGVPTALALATQASIGYIELWTTWATAPTAFVCSQFMIWGIN